MECSNCTWVGTISKNLRRPSDTTKGPSHPTCPECGERLDKSDGGNRDLIMK